MTTATENVIYTTDCMMFRVIEQDGLYFPQQRIVFTSAFGRVRNAKDLERVSRNPINNVQYGAWKGWVGGYTQYPIRYKGDKSFKTEQGAIKFVDRYSAQLNEEA